MLCNRMVDKSYIGKIENLHSHARTLAGDSKVTKHVDVEIPMGPKDMFKVF